MDDPVVEEGEPGCFVRVTGISRETTEDALVNFFLNTRRSGGGEIKDSHLKLEEGVADITFMTRQVAERVVQKEKLVLDEAKLTTTLITDPKSLPTDKRCVHVSGISDRTTKDGLMSYMEVASGEEVESVLFGDNSNAMVIFKDPPDFEKLFKVCIRKPLDTQHLKIEQGNICDCIEVTGLSPKTTKDAVLYYFENSRNGGGDVRKVEYDKEAGKALVFFDYHSVVDDVLKQDHLMDGAHLTINRYYTFLGETYFTNPSGGKKDRVVEINPKTMMFIKEQFCEEFDRLLQDHRVKYTWQQGSREIVLVCADPKMDKKTWMDSCDVVVAYINQIVKEKITVSKEVWEKISDEARKKYASFVMDFKTEENSLVLKGKKPDVSELGKHLQDLASRIEEQITIEKSKISEKIQLSDVQMELMNCTGFVDSLKIKHEGIEVTIISDSNDQVIQLRGLEEDVKECTAFVWQTLSNVKETEVKLSTSVVSILGSDRGKAFLATSFKNNSIEAIISFDSSADAHVMVTAMDRDHMDKAVDFIKNIVAEESIPLDKDQTQLFESEKWKEFKHSMQQSMLLQVTEEPETSRLLLVGFKEDVDTAKDEVKKFFQDNVISKREISVGTGRAKFLFKHALTSMNKIEKTLKKHSVKVTWNASVGTIVVTGTKEGIDQAVAQVDLLVDNVKYHMLEVDADVTRQEYEEMNWSVFLDGVATNRNCVIERCDGANSTVKRKIQVFADDDITIQRVEEDIKAFIEREQVVNSITTKSQKIIESTMEVLPYYFFRRDSSVNPGKEILVKIDPQMMEFVHKFLKEEFGQLLQDHRVKCTWQQGSGEVVLGCADTKMDKKTLEVSCDAVAVYINHFVTEKITVSQEAWKETYEKAKEKYASFKDRVAINCKEKERSFMITGKESDVSVLAEQLNDLKCEIQKQIEYEKSKISKSVPLSEAQIELLSCSGFVEDLQARCKDLEVKLLRNDLAIKFRGSNAVVKEGNITVWQTLSKVKELDMELPKSIVDVVGSPPGKILIATKFKKEHIDAVVNCDPNSDNQLVVTAVDRKDAKKAVDLIKDLTSEQIIPLDDHQKQLIHSGKWKELKHSIEQSMLIRVREELETSTLRIAGIKEEVDKATENVDSFFKENIIVEKFIDVEKGRLKFIYKHKIDAVRGIDKSLSNQSVKILKKTDADNEVSALVVSGTRDGIQQAVPKVRKLINDIKDRRVDLDKPGMKKFFSKKKGVTLLSVIENDHDCIIERCTPATADTKERLSKRSHGRNRFSKLICSFLTPEGKTISLYKGDLTEHEVDVMVNSANESLKHIGGLAKSILEKGGKEIQDECDNYVIRNGPLLDGEVYVSKPGNLPCKRLVHAVGPKWGFTRRNCKLRTQGEEKKALILGQTVFNSLQEAENFSSIAIPAISAGVFGCPVKVCAKTLIESALEYSEENADSRLSEIHFVDMNDDVVKALYDEMKTRFGKALTQKSMTEFVENQTALSSHPKDMMWLQIYAASGKDLIKAESDIHKLIKENSKITEIDHQAISKLSDAQKRRILELEALYDTKIEITKRINRIFIRGVAEDVSNTTVAVYDILNERSEEEHSRRYAELLAKNVQWYYEDGDTMEPYDDETNAQIEEAYNDKKPNVRLSLQEEGKDEPTTYIIVFNSMTETNLRTGETARVDRRDKTAGIPLPPYWDPQPTDSNGKEVDVHIVLLDPNKHAKEYDNVKKAIERTMVINIVKIERVQNPALYKTYAVKKQKMDDRSGSNEKKLFHTTAAATCQLINHQGFNRSFCGKNVTLFGKGVYFARDASYSMHSRYSPPDSAGNRYMYMASVLVGEYTQGYQDMVAPPSKNPTIPTITYDSVVDNVSNPSIFVVFHDTQNYPDYLITFR